MILVSASIDTQALRHNLGVARQRAPHSRVMAVVKANAYGHGLAVVARALESADAFAVARIDEGLALRDSGIRAPILLLEGVFDAEQLQAAAAARFELVVHTPEQINLLRDAPPGAKFKIWLKLDSGMNRLGFKGDAFAVALDALRQLPAVPGAVNLFTHLAAADEPALPTTTEQLARFAAATAGLPGERSIANSAAVLGVAAARTDWVRPGLLLYGASPFSGSVGADHGLRPVMTLHSHVIAVKDVAVGERVGYGGTWLAQRPTRLAVTAGGYGDGYPRNVAAGACVLVNGQRMPLIGRVSMDMFGVDVSGMRDTPVPGDSVVLWGEGLPVEEPAGWAGTIPYEILCGVSQRVARTAR